MTSPAMAKAKKQTLRLSGQIVDLIEPGRLPQPERERERERATLMPTPTVRDYKDSSVAVAKHRPLDKDTLTRALAHLENEF